MHFHRVVIENFIVRLERFFIDVTPCGIVPPPSLKPYTAIKVPLHRVNRIRGLIRFPIIYSEYNIRTILAYYIHVTAIFTFYLM